MEKIYFRPNAPISSLFNDLPNETIIIDEDTISETITDYQGNILVEKDAPQRIPIEVLETLIASFDNVYRGMRFEPASSSWEDLCFWFKTVLESRGWVPMKSGQGDVVDSKEVKCVNGQELFFEMEID